VALINFWIFVSCLSLAGETVEPYATEHASLFKWIEYAAVLFFTIDYLGNLYYAKDRVKYFFSFWGLVDLVSILPTFLMIMNLTALQGTKVFRILRVVRVLRVLKMARIALQQLEQKIESSNPIITNLRIYFIALFSVIMISSTLMYYVEGNLYSAEALAEGQAALDAKIAANPLPADAPPEASKFIPVDPISGNPIPEDKRFYTSIPAAMWWCIVTLTTTGYGDMFPLTFGGRVVAGITMLLGLVLFGILLNIVGKTIMVLLFGEQLTEENTTPSSREAILKMMVARKWITERRAYELELMSEEDIQRRAQNL
jgi:voltage-gated potassium channel Kch